MMPYHREFALRSPNLAMRRRVSLPVAFAHRGISLHILLSAGSLSSVKKRLLLSLHLSEKGRRRFRSLRQFHYLSTRILIFRTQSVEERNAAGIDSVIKEEKLLEPLRKIRVTDQHETSSSRKNKTDFEKRI